jgi:NADH:ubiquinone oxidoreductase subunit 4 (subunit M)
VTYEMLTPGLVLVPFGTAVLLVCLSRWAVLRRTIALAALVVQVMSITIIYFSSSAPAAFEAAWLPALGSQIYLSVDGINAQGLLMLAAVLVAAVIAEIHLPKKRSSTAALALIFVVAATLNLLLLSRDILLAAAAHGTAALALAALLGIGTDLAGQSAARRFANHAVVGTILLSAAAAILAASGGTTLIDDMSRIDPESTRLVALLLMAAVALQIPLVPMHTWLAPVVAAGSVAGRILVLGGWSAAGAFCLLRFGLGLFPDLFAYAAPMPLLWGGVTVAYAAFLAIAQNERDLLRRISWMTVGAGGLLLVGVAGLEELSILGAWMHASGQALPRVGLLLLAHWITSTGARGGSVAAIWVALALGLTAAPGLALFPGWLFIVTGTADTIVVSLLIVAGAVGSFALIAPAMHLAGGNAGPPMPAALSRLLLAVMVAIVSIGLAPGALVTRAHLDVERLLERGVEAPTTEDEAVMDGESR